LDLEEAELFVEVEVAVLDFAGLEVALDLPQLSLILRPFEQAGSDVFACGLIELLPLVRVLAMALFFFILRLLLREIVLGPGGVGVSQALRPRLIIISLLIFFQIIVSDLV